MDTFFYWTGAAMWGFGLLVVLAWLLDRLLSLFERHRLTDNRPTLIALLQEELQKHDFVVSAEGVTGNSGKVRVILSNQREIFVQRVSNVSDRVFEVRYNSQAGMALRLAKI